MAVTIIVLLILAAVAINLTVGENGIFTRAQNATQKWQEAEVNEQKEMNGLVDWMDELSNKVTDENPGELSGEGTEQNPYLIQSIEDLVAFSQESYYNNFANEYISLDLTLDFNSDSSYVDPNGNQFGDINGNSITEGLKTELTTGRGFIPIGSNYGTDFSGNFNGNNYSINNLYINSDGYSNSGLFADIENASVKNLKVSGTIKSGGSYIGGIIRIADNSRIENCINNVAVEGNGDRVGGIVGMASGSEVINCINKAVIENNGGYNVGGIAGAAYSSEVINCINKANITGNNTNRIGGIVGEISGPNVINCSNYGQISLINIQDDSQIGGIAGSGNTVTIDNCFNYGMINCKANPDMLYRGDLIGQDSEFVQIKDNCKNNGTIEVIEDDSISYDVCVGGIIGGYVSPS